jgi:hypothetical protein
MTHDPGNIRMSEIYHTLDDGRIIELIIGEQINNDDAMWARNLSDREKEIYLKLKSSGRSDKDIYNRLNLKVKNELCAER